ncbi:MAG: glycoside hydrolase [Bacteroidetes bacterium]|nr:glycoside hydrolase [Bacteroidota bacterium]
MTSSLRPKVAAFFIIAGFFSSIFSQGSPDAIFDRFPKDLEKTSPPFISIESVPVTIGDYDNFFFGTEQAEPHFSMDPTNPKRMFAAYNINAAYYTADGWNWTRIVPSFGVSVQGDPLTAWGRDGVLHYQSMFGNITGSKNIRSTDGGVTWTAAVTGVDGVDKNWMAIDQTTGPYSNYIYNVMTAGSGMGNIHRSTDGGVTFSRVTQLSTQALPGMMSAVGPYYNGTSWVDGGSVFVVTHSGTNAAGIYSFYHSTNGGATFTLKSQQTFSNVIGTEISGRSTVQNMRTRPYPMIAADNSTGPYRGRLYLVYASNSPAGSGNKSDVFSRYSTDYGATWSAPKLVNDDANPQNNHSFFPAIWCDISSGRLYVKFYDTRLVPTSDSMDVFATYTDDGGQSFAANYRITNKTAKIKQSSGTGANYQGDYDAIQSVGNQAFMAYTDFRNNSFGAYGSYFPDYGMRVLPANVSVGNDLDSTFIYVSVPSVKAYTKSVKFSAAISPAPTSGNFFLRFEGKDSLTTYPDSLKLWIRTSGGVPEANYTVTVTGEGAGGTPVHKRTSNVTVTAAVPVELTSFIANSDGYTVKLDWTTATETNNKGFEVERAVDQASGLAWSRISFVEGKGTTSEENSYVFTDRSVTKPGRYFYRLRQVDFDGRFEYTKAVEAIITTPSTFELHQNYPNPFNPSTVVSFSLPVESRVKLNFYDAAGNLVESYDKGTLAAGLHQHSQVMASVASGAYFYSIEAVSSDGKSSFRANRKMMLIK